MANKIQADEGFVFAKADKSAVYGTLMYLGINDKPENYIQIPVAEADAIKAEIEAKLNAENKVEASAE